MINDKIRIANDTTSSNYQSYAKKANHEKSAEAIVPYVVDDIREGLNLRRC